jgi:hypothetical protein
MFPVVEMKDVKIFYFCMSIDLCKFELLNTTKYEVLANPLLGLFFNIVQACMEVYAGQFALHKPKYRLMQTTMP